MKFKVGDKVKVVAANCHQPKELIGNTYTVVYVDSWDHYVLNTDDPWGWNEKELELVKPKFNHKDYPGKYAMHVNTEEQAETFVNYMRKVIGYKWYDNCFDPYKEQTCYNFNGDAYQCVSYYKDKGYTILEFEDFDWGDFTMTVEEKREKLYTYCDCRTCTGCPLDGDTVPCGRGYSFHKTMGHMPEDKILLAYDIVFGGKDMEKKFTKADLKNGDVIQRRDGDIEIVCIDTGTILNKDHGAYNLNDVHDNLTSRISYKRDIVAVRRPRKWGDCDFSAFKNDRGLLVYERKEVEEMTLEEVCKALGKEIKIVKK